MLDFSTLLFRVLSMMSPVYSYVLYIQALWNLRKETGGYSRP